VLNKNPGELSLLYAEEIRVFDAWDSWSFEGMHAWRENLHN
jgi:hypothetical protein